MPPAPQFLIKKNENYKFSVNFSQINQDREEVGKGSGKEGEGEKDEQSLTVCVAKLTQAGSGYHTFKMSPQGLAQVCGARVEARASRVHWTLDIADEGAHARINKPLFF